MNLSVSITSLYGPKVITQSFLSSSQKIEDYRFPSLSTPDVNLKSQMHQVHNNKYKCLKNGSFSGFAVSVGA